MSTRQLKLELIDTHAELTLQKGDTLHQPSYEATFQSNLLIILRFDKTRVVIFKDSLAEKSLSSLNRLLNVS